MTSHVCPLCGSLRMWPSIATRRDPNAALWHCLETGCKGRLAATPEELSVARGPLSTETEDPEELNTAWWAAENERWAAIVAKRDAVLGGVSDPTTTNEQAA